MHRCLRIAEIVRNIAFGTNELSNVNADVLNFALVCQAFYEPAMDALWWYILGDISPLVKLLPSSVLEYDDEDELLVRLSSLRADQN